MLIALLVEPSNASGTGIVNTVLRCYYCDECLFGIVNIDATAPARLLLLYYYYYTPTRPLYSYTPTQLLQRLQLLPLLLLLPLGR